MRAQQEEDTWGYLSFPDSDEEIGISSLWRVLFLLDPEISNEDPNMSKNLLEMDNRKNMGIFACLSFFE